MNVSPTEIMEFVDIVRQKRPTTLSRWGDGEFRALMGDVRGSNCDRHPFSQELHRDLLQIIRSRPGYRIGIQGLVLQHHKYAERVPAWLKKEGLQDLAWDDADVFHKASSQDALDPFVDALRSSTLLLVGPEHLSHVYSMLGMCPHVKVPESVRYSAVAGIVKDTAAMLRGCKHAVVSISAGMSANILIDRLFREFGDRHILLDLGSLWDPFAGVYSRSYMRADPDRYRRGLKRLSGGSHGT